MPLGKGLGQCVFAQLKSIRKSILNPLYRGKTVSPTTSGGQTGAAVANHLLTEKFTQVVVLREIANLI